MEIFKNPVFIHMLEWTDENGPFQKNHGMVSCERFQMVDGRITFVSLLLWLFSRQISSNEINLTLLNAQADYVRKRLDIIRLLSRPNSKGSLKCLDRG